MANILQMLSKESIVEMKKKNSSWVLWFWFLQLHLFLQMLKKALLKWKKKQLFRLNILLTISLAIHRNLKKKGVIEGSTLKIYQITQNALFILLLSK